MTDVSNKNSQEKIEKKNSRWRRAVGIFAALAEISNVGILINTVAQWFSVVAMLSQMPIFIYLTSIADRLIYFFRSLIRKTRLIGRAQNIKFEEEQYDASPSIKKWRNFFDLVSLSLFVLAIVTFSGLLIAPPVNVTVAWALALTGLTPIGFFDYIYPAKQLAKKYESHKRNPKIRDETKDRFERKHIRHQNSMKLYMALLVALTLLLVCGTAVAFAPVLIVPILKITAKIASIFLGAIAIGRVTNYFFSNEPQLYRYNQMPEDINLKKLCHDYIFIENDNTKRLFYVTHSEQLEAVQIEDMDKFSRQVEANAKKQNTLLGRFIKSIKRFMGFSVGLLSLSEKLHDKIIPLDEIEISPRDRYISLQSLYPNENAKILPLSSKLPTEVAIDTNDTAQQNTNPVPGKDMPLDPQAAQQNGDGSRRPSNDANSRPSQAGQFSSSNNGHVPNDTSVVYQPPAAGLNPS